MAGLVFSNTISLSYCVNIVSTWNCELPFSLSWKCVFSSQYLAAWLQTFWVWGCLVLDFQFRLSMCCALRTQPSRGVWMDAIPGKFYTVGCSEKDSRAPFDRGNGEYIDHKMKSETTQIFKKIGWWLKFFKLNSHSCYVNLVCHPCELVLQASCILHHFSLIWCIVFLRLVFKCLSVLNDFSLIVLAACMMRIHFSKVHHYTVKHSWIIGTWY